MSTSSARAGMPAEFPEESREAVAAARSARGWVSERPAGAKVCSLRLDVAHLVHTGLAPAWGRDEIQAYFGDCAVEIVGATAAAIPPPGPLPPAVAAWDEAIRFGHRELWESGGELGTTAVLETDGALWVLSRGGHTVEIESTPGHEPVSVPAPSRRGQLWQLDRSRPWTVRVRTAPDAPPLWSARWFPGTDGATRPAAGREPAGGAAPSLRAVPSPGGRPPGAPSAPGSSGFLDVARRWLSQASALLPVALRRRLVPIALGAGLVLALGLAVLAVPAELRSRAGLWIGDVVTARYRVTVTSHPEGARVLVDGEDTGRTTPTRLALTPGEHRVVLSFDEHGEAALVARGGRGGRSALHAALFGRLVISNANPETELHVRLDGRPLGKLPAVLDSVPVGRRRLSFQGRDVRPWVEEVDVVADRTTQLTASPELVPETGVVVARAWRVGPQGLTEVPGAAVWLDGKRAGWTPARLEVARGVHTVRLTTREERSPVQLLRVDGGGELFATAEFGRSPEPEVIVEAPAAAKATEPLAVTARLESPMPIRVGGATLFLRRGREFSRHRMSLAEGDRGLVAGGTLPSEGLEPGDEVEFYVMVASDQGEEFYSEIRRTRLRP